MAVDRSARTDVLIVGLILAFTAVPTHVRPFSFDALLDVFGFSPADAVANVLGYIPLGMVWRKLGTFRAVALAGMLSLVAETVQIFCVGRDPQVVDVTTNVLGAGLGVWLAGKWRPLPERVAVTPTLAATAGVVAIAYIASGATVTAETIVDKFAGWWETPPWAATNLRGSVSEGTLEAHWSFDRLGDDVIADTSAGQLNGTTINSPTLTPGVFGSAILLSGKQWVDVGKPVALRLTGSMTLSAWVKPSKFPWDDAAIISSLTRREFGYQLDLTVDQGPRTVGFKLKDAAGHLMARFGATPIVAGRWYHVAGVYDAESRTLDVYVDGRRDNGCLLGTVTDRQQPSAGRVFVGARPGDAGYEFIGAIDEAEIQSRPLRESEIQAAVGVAGRVNQPSAQGLLDQDRASADVRCTHSTERPLRTAGPLVSLGILIALAGVGLRRRTARLDLVTAVICLLTGSTAMFWMSPSAMLEPVWLATLYIVSGGIVGLVACRAQHPELQ